MMTGCVVGGDRADVDRKVEARTQGKRTARDLRQLLTELQHDTEQLPRHPGVILRWELPHGSEPLRIDPMKFKIVVRNLIGNALKFTRRGHVAVQVTHEPRSRVLDVQVKDTGAGIDPAHLPHIFDMFHQAPGDAFSGGVGLGLYIVKRFVDLLGGRVSATSHPGEGSTFRVSIPAVMAVQPASLEAHRLRACLLLGHVIDAEELVVAEEQTIHHEFPWTCAAVSALAKRRTSSIEPVK